MSSLENLIQDKKIIFFTDNKDEAYKTSLKTVQTIGERLCEETPGITHLTNQPFNLCLYIL